MEIGHGFNDAIILSYATIIQFLRQTIPDERNVLVTILEPVGQTIEHNDTRTDALLRLELRSQIKPHLATQAEAGNNIAAILLNNRSNHLQIFLNILFGSSGREREVVVIGFDNKDVVFVLNQVTHLLIQEVVAGIAADNNHNRLLLNGRF